jgi:hypothetical protein
VAAPSKAWVCARSFLGLRVRIPRGHWCVSVVSVVCYQVERSIALGLSLVQRSLTECCVPYWVWSWSLNNRETLDLYRLLRHWRGGGGCVICFKILNHCVSRIGWCGSLSLGQVLRVSVRKRSIAEFSSFHVPSLLVTILILFIADNILRLIKQININMYYIKQSPLTRISFQVRVDHRS